MSKEVLKKLEAIEERLAVIERKLGAIDKTARKDSKLLAGVLPVLQSIVKNQCMFYGKFLLTRLNLLEISEGKRPSISVNEKREIENSKAAQPKPSFFPAVTREPVNLNKPATH